MSAAPCSSTVAHPRLRAAFQAGEFAVTAEIGPPRGADLGAVRESAVVLRDWVHAANITDNQGAQVRVSSLAGSVAALAAGLEPVMQMTCRDRNRIALQSDLLAAGALGVPNLLLMTGDRPERGDHADAIAREELTAAGLDRAIWQCPVVLLADVRSVGVQGDGRTYGHPVVLRPVSSEDAMTADWTRLPYDVLERISTRITNEVADVNRVVLDVTSKPPGTIEWE